MRIFVDMDDVLVELLDEWLFQLNKKVNVFQKKEYSDIVDWDMKLAYPNLTPDQIYGVLYFNSFWENVKPVKNAYKYLKKLYDDGHEVYIATASVPNSFAVKTEQCLLKCFDFLTPKNLICIQDKYILDGDILFDDYHENLRKFKGIKVLKDAPYNKLCDDECFHFRVGRDNAWEEFYKIVKELENVRRMFV